MFLLSSQGCLMGMSHTVPEREQAAGIQPPPPPPPRPPPTPTLTPDQSKRQHGRQCSSQGAHGMHGMQAQGMAYRVGQGIQGRHSCCLALALGLCPPFFPSPPSCLGLALNLQSTGGPQPTGPVIIPK
jgi:hypothetical protein